MGNVRRREPADEGLARPHRNVVRRVVPPPPADLSPALLRDQIHGNPTLSSEFLIWQDQLYWRGDFTEQSSPDGSFASLDPTDIEMLMSEEDSSSESADDSGAPSYRMHLALVVSEDSDVESETEESEVEEEE